MSSRLDLQGPRAGATRSRGGVVQSISGNVGAHLSETVEQLHDRRDSSASETLLGYLRAGWFDWASSNDGPLYFVRGRSKSDERDRDSGRLLSEFYLFLGSGLMPLDRLEAAEIPVGWPPM